MYGVRLIVGLGYHSYFSFLFLQFNLQCLVVNCVVCLFVVVFASFSFFDFIFLAFLAVDLLFNFVKEMSVYV